MGTALIGLLGIFLGAVLTILRELWVNERKRQKQAEYLAIRISCTLDLFVDGCIAVARDNGIDETEDPRLIGEVCREVQVPEPKLELHSMDVDWKALPPELMYHILAFPNDIASARQLIDRAWKHPACSPPDYDVYFEERQYQYAQLGMTAHTLSERLREDYREPL